MLKKTKEKNSPFEGSHHSIGQEEPSHRNTHNYRGPDL